MSRERVVSEVLQWFGLLGAPAAWTVQHIVGFALSEVGCEEMSGAGWVTNVDPWALALMLATAAMVVAAGAAAIATFRRTRGVGEHGEPPRGRMYFLSLIGIAICPLFLAMILMSGLGYQELSGCLQS